MNVDDKRIPNQRKKNIFTDRIFLPIAFEKMKLLKMHQIIKPTCPSRQLFIKITFAFMSVTAGIQLWFRAVTRDVNLSIEREMLQKWLF